MLSQIRVLLLALCLAHEITFPDAIKQKDISLVVSHVHGHGHGHDDGHAGGHDDGHGHGHKVEDDSHGHAEVHGDDSHSEQKCSPEHPCPGKALMMLAPAIAFASFQYYWHVVRE
eukprot:TRINITY_DN105105_c0_g1_i1.p2 TRINITY_DN105105_c0_g1~~TRINITY_DN105105_c0_g1_i1.p2  ORF type:complete len:115 (-),score=19.70 TRINITY_DN105105_c0_g1_i1:184-528(-)